MTTGFRTSCWHDNEAEGKEGKECMIKGVTSHTEERCVRYVVLCDDCYNKAKELHTILFSKDDAMNYILDRGDDE